MNYEKQTLVVKEDRWQYNTSVIDQTDLGVAGHHTQQLLNIPSHPHAGVYIYAYAYTYTYTPTHRTFI